jgi:hypothetical protein
MASAAQTYQGEMHGNVGFFATWLPGDHVEVGDVGTIVAGRFRKATSLDELGITREVSSKASPQDMQYSSRSGASVRVSGGASVAGVPGVSAEIDVQFTHAGAFVFQASNLRQERLEGRGALTAAILQAYDRGAWTKGWLLVEALHHADCATIIVAEEGSAGLLFKAKAPVALGALPLANPDVRLEVQSMRGRTMQVVAGRGLKPLYSCVRIRDGWFSEPSLVAVRGRGDASEDALVRPGIDELLNA